MVEAIGINNNNNKKTGFSEFTIRPAIKYTAPKIATQPKQDIVNIKKQNKKAQPLNTLQIASLAIGTLASTVLIAYFARSSGIFGKNKSLLKQIQKADVPNKVREKLLFEYDKFRKSDMDIDNSQNYITNVLKLNWNKPEEKLIDLNKAKEILDNELIGLDNVKEELLTYFSVRNHNIKHNINNDEGTILCLQGPPGVAKTSVAEIVAKIMGKPFERMSLGGESDASAINGIARWYKGSAPGKIITSLQDSKVSDPVILIDELDKAGISREHGDPASVLLDVFEPKQCKKFTDRYLEIPYDLSNVTFIITANELNSIPKALRNRVSVIPIGNYSRQTKFDICKFNIPKKLEHLKIDSSKIKFTSDGLTEIVNRTHDEGARETNDNLKRVFNHIIKFTEAYGDDKNITVNRAFVVDALKNKQ